MSAASQVLWRLACGPFGRGEINCADPALGTSQGDQVRRKHKGQRIRHDQPRRTIHRSSATSPANCARERLVATFVIATSKILRPDSAMGLSDDTPLRLSLARFDVISADCHDIPTAARSMVGKTMLSGSFVECFALQGSCRRVVMLTLTVHVR